MIQTMPKTKILAFMCLLFQTNSVFSGEADVIKATANKQSDGSYLFSVTVQHIDEGWDHYANKWDVVGPDGTLYGTRTLYHPHVNEQPFTRSLSGVNIPSDIKQVTLKAHDSVHGYGGEAFQVQLP